MWEHLFKDTQFGAYKYTVAMEKIRQVSGGQDTLHVQGITIDDLNISKNAADDLVITTQTRSSRTGFQYAYYEGYWERLPDFSTLTVVKSGYSETIDLHHRTRDEGIGVVFDGQITITQGGQYTFFTTSDEGSKLYIDDLTVVDNDGLHGAQECQGTVALSAVQHRVRVEFFEKGGGEVLQVHFQGPDTHHGKLALHTGHARIQADDTTHIVIKNMARQDGELGNNLVDNSISIETLQFQDGLKLHMGPIQDFNTDSNEDDNLIAANHATALLGHGGQDILTGSDYQDILIGGRGNDTLNGGKGDDTYVFSRSAQGGERDIFDEHYVTQEIRTREVLQVVDRIWDPVWNDWFRHVDVRAWQTEAYTIDVTKTDNIDNDTIKFDGSITITDITRSRVGNDLILNIANPDIITGHDDQIIIVNDNIEYIELANGLMVSIDALRDDQTVGVYPSLQVHTDHYVQIGSDAGDDIIGHLSQTNIIWSGSGHDTVQVMAQDVVNTNLINGGAGVDHLILMDHTGINLDVSAIDFEQVSAGDGDDVITRARHTRSGFHYQYYEGDWDQLPDFSTLAAVKSGYSETIDLSHRIRDEGIGMVFTGQITITQGGQYTFFTTSDDGSKLYIDDWAVVDNDGLHAARERQGEMHLAAGQHTLSVEFFERCGGEVLQVHLQGPDTGGEKRPCIAPQVPIHTDLGMVYLDDVDYTFRGQGGDDVLSTGMGDDHLYGGDGHDNLSSGAGDDVLCGGAGTDQLHAGAGDDLLYVDQADLDTGQIDGGSGIDRLVLIGEARFAQSVDNLAVEHVLAGAADDLIWGSRSDTDYIFWAGTGADRLHSSGGNDWLLGESGDDVLQSQAGDDVLQGGQGYDLLDGGLGDDSYWFNRGDGYDILSDCGGVDQLLFGRGIDIADLVIRPDQTDLLIYVRGANLASTPLDKLTDCICIQNWQSQNQRVEKLGFSHGIQFELSHIQDTVATYDADIAVLYGGARNDVIQGNGMVQSLYGFGGDDIVLGSDQAELLYGGLGADTLHGGNGDDVITGAGGDDHLLASRGHDVYKFGRGDGRDLFEGSSAKGMTGAAVFDIDVDRQWLWFEQNGDDLVMRILHGDERITFRDWYRDGEEINAHVAAFSSRDKAVLLAGQVQQSGFIGRCWSGSPAAGLFSQRQSS